MNIITIILAVFEFGLTAVLSLLVVYVIYAMFIATNPDYDAEAEMKNGNVAVAILLAALLLAAGMMIKQGIFPVVNLVRLYFTGPTEDLSLAALIGYVLANLLLVFLVTVYTMSLSLRLWGRLTKHVRAGEELKRGNLAVGMVLSAMVVVISLFVSDGVSRLTRALIPQPSVGHVEIAH